MAHPRAGAPPGGGAVVAHVRGVRRASGATARAGVSPGPGPTRPCVVVRRVRATGLGPGGEGLDPLDPPGVLGGAPGPGFSGGAPGPVWAPPQPGGVWAGAAAAGSRAGSVRGLPLVDRPGEVGGTTSEVQVAWAAQGERAPPRAGQVRGGVAAGGTPARTGRHPTRGARVEVGGPHRWINRRGRAPHVGSAHVEDQLAGHPPFVQLGQGTGGVP